MTFKIGCSFYNLRQLLGSQILLYYFFLILSSNFFKLLLQKVVITIYLKMNKNFCVFLPHYTSLKKSFFFYCNKLQRKDTAKTLQGMDTESKFWTAHSPIFSQSLLNNMFDMWIYQLNIFNNKIPPKLAFNILSLWFLFKIYSFSYTYNLTCTIC